MASTIFPIASASTINADSYTVPAAYKEYKIIKNFEAAVYQVTTSPTDSQATVTFFGSTTAPQTTTVLGTVTYNLTVDATDAAVSISSGSNTVVTISKVAAALTGAEFSGTLDTVTSTGNYDTTGSLYVMTVGGGGGGSAGQGNTGSDSRPGKGGGKGAIAVKVVKTNSATAVTIGSAGTSAGTNGGNAGGTTSFGNLVSSAGGNGSAGLGNNPYANVQGYYGTADPANSSLYTTITAGTNGGGGVGSQTYSANNTQGPTNGTGSGIGTGGNGGGVSGAVGQPGNAATGYGAGGGGGAGYSNGGYQAGNGNGGAGGAGSAGVIYVLRGFA